PSYHPPAHPPPLPSFPTRRSSDLTHHRSRHLTHRAVLGFSMGGVGAANFGLRHHDRFDVIAPLGGPGDWTWLLWYIEHFAFAGLDRKSTRLNSSHRTISYAVFCLK